MSRAPQVVKIGGSLTDPSGLLDDIAAFDSPLIVIHGAHRVLDDLAVRLGTPPRFVTSVAGATSRYTDDDAMDQFLMAYCGHANKRLVEQLLWRGAAPVGLAAMDGGMVRGRRRADLRVREDGRTLVLHGDHTGSIGQVDTTLLHTLLQGGFLPVLCPPALGHDGTPINVDGDRLAAEVAIAMGAERLVIASDTAGFLADAADPSSTVDRACAADLARLAGSAEGRARVKLTAVGRALSGGVGSVGLCDGRGPHPLQAALAGAGSWFTPSAVVAV